MTTYPYLTLSALLLFALLVGALVYRAGRLTRSDRERRRLILTIGPYVKRRRRDRPGHALARGAALAYASGKITRKQLELFRCTPEALLGPVSRP